MQYLCTKKTACLLAALVFSNSLGSAPVFAQQATCPGIGSGSLGLLSGHWATSNAHRTVTIGRGLPADPNFFQISFSREFSDPIRSEFRVFDGIDMLSRQTYDDANVGIEGTNIELTQVDAIPAPLDGQSGCWAAPDLSPEARPYRTIFWMAKPRIRTLIVNLKRPRVMVIGLSSYLGNIRVNGNEIQSGCPIGTATIFVDGNPLRARDGSNIVFLNGTSIAVVGQTIDVGWAPGCPATNTDQYLRGSLKIDLQAVAASH